MIEKDPQAVHESDASVDSGIGDALLDVIESDERAEVLQNRIDAVVQAHTDGRISSDEYTEQVEALETAMATNKSERTDLHKKVNSQRTTIGRRIIRFLHQG